MSKDRSKYFRARTKIGRIELKAQAVCDDLGHEFFMIRDDRSATSFGCSDCKVWGCAEVDGKKAAFHGLEVFLEMVAFHYPNLPVM